MLGKGPWKEGLMGTDFEIDILEASANLPDTGVIASKDSSEFRVQSSACEEPDRFMKSVKCGMWNAEYKCVTAD